MKRKDRGGQAALEWIIFGALMCQIWCFTMHLVKKTLSQTVAEVWGMQSVRNHLSHRSIHLLPGMEIRKYKNHIESAHTQLRYGKVFVDSNIGYQDKLNWRSLLDMLGFDLLKGGEMLKNFKKEVYHSVFSFFGSRSFHFF